MPPAVLPSFLGIGLFMAFSTAGVLAYSPDAAGPRPELGNATLFQSTGQQAQPQTWVPVTDLTVEVIGVEPVQTEVLRVTRMLGQRQAASSGKNDYPPTIFELIKLVEPNPQKPGGRSWKRVTALTISFDRAANDMIVEYCIAKCAPDQLTHRKRKMISYRAPVEDVATRLTERIAELESSASPYRAVGSMPSPSIATVIVK